LIKQLSIAVIATTATLSVFPAFASGFGPAPYYNASQGAPASQRGVSSQTVAAEQAQTQGNASADQPGTLHAKISSNEATQ
jgi:hypothetical protein